MNYADLRNEFICRVCDQSCMPSHVYSVELGVCGECARKLGAAWLKAHTGECHPLLDPYGAAAQRVKDAKRYKKKTIPQWLRWQVFERDEFRCVKCKTHKDLRADHVVAEIKGGPMTLANLQTLCAPCNTAKGARDA